MFIYEVTLEPLKAQQGPDQQPVVAFSLKMLVEFESYEFLVKPPALLGTLVQENRLDVIYGRAAVPVLVRG
jgi:hypothetical protein